MKPISILRIQNKNGKGMFRTTEYDAYDVIPEACNRHFIWKEDCTGEYFPKPEEDNLKLYKGNGREWFCAFLSLEQLNSLIYPDEIKKLLEVGYNILLLTVTEYQKGKHQVLFTREPIIETKNLNSLF